MRITQAATVGLLSLLFASAIASSQVRDNHARSPVLCGTPAFMQERAELEALVEKGVLPASVLQSSSRPTLTSSIVSPDGHFRVHYDETGKNAPPPFDANGNGVPDMVDSVAVYLDYAWQVQIVESGYKPPPADNFKPSIGGPDGLLDVYMIEQNGSIYGEARPESGAELSPTTTSGYLIIDNDFAEFPTKGFKGARVTTAHEFYHLVQFAGYRDDYSQSGLFESTATWMEIHVHPDLEDYLNYVNVLVQAPQNYAFSTHQTGSDGGGAVGYGHSTYIQYIQQETETDVVRRIWEMFAINGASFTAINDALLESDAGLNLSTSFCNYAEVMYQSGPRAPVPPLLPGSEKFAEMSAAQTLSLEPMEPRVVVSALSPLSFGIWRFVLRGENSSLPDTLDMLVTNARSNLGVGGRQWIQNKEEFNLTVSLEEFSGSTPISFRDRTIYYAFEAPHFEFCVSPFFNGSSGTILSSAPSPQPFVNDGANQMIVAINLDASEVNSYAFNIYTTDMKRVLTSFGTELFTSNNLRGVRWDGRDEEGRLLPSGVYLYTLQVNGLEPVLGKIAVVRP